MASWSDSSLLEQEPAPVARYSHAAEIMARLERQDQEAERGTRLYRALTDALSANSATKHPRSSGFVIYQAMRKFATS